MADTDSQPLTLRRILLVIATGVGAGFLSGLVGVGGGSVIMPGMEFAVGAILFNIFLLSIIASTILKTRRARAQMLRAEASARYPRALARASAMSPRIRRDLSTISAGAAASSATHA